MRAKDDTLFYLGAGPIATIALGAALIPLRGVTTASNFAFVFLVLVIVVGHAGGRWPATATALVSALSLNFFLTRPYLTLTIHGRDDVIAFLALTACGLVAAALGARRADSLLRRRQLDVLHVALLELELAGPAASRAQELLESVYSSFPVSALALRDEGGRLIASAGDRTRLSGIPSTVAPEDTPGFPAIQPPGGQRRAAPLPPEGLRLPLVIAKRALGGLDLWGDGRPAGGETRSTLRALARVIAAMLAEDQAVPPATGDPGPPRSAWVTFSRGGSRE